jgi:hypothetical protein
MITVDPDHVGELCPELRVLLDAELKAGNRITDTSKGWPKPNSIFVLLAEPFKAMPAPLPPGVNHVDVDDPHWWKGEYKHTPTGHVLACRF